MILFISDQKTIYRRLKVGFKPHYFYRTDLCQRQAIIGGKDAFCPWDFSYNAEIIKPFIISLFYR